MDLPKKNTWNRPLLYTEFCGQNHKIQQKKFQNAKFDLRLGYFVRLIVYVCLHMKFTTNRYLNQKSKGAQCQGLGALQMLVTSHGRRWKTH